MSVGRVSWACQLKRLTLEPLRPLFAYFLSSLFLSRARYSTSEFWWSCSPACSLASASSSQFTPVSSPLPNTDCTALGLVQIAGQAQAPDRGSHSKHWAKLCNLGQPCETHLPLVSSSLFPWLMSPAGSEGGPNSCRAVCVVPSLSRRGSQAVRIARRL